MIKKLLKVSVFAGLIAFFLVLKSLNASAQPEIKVKVIDEILMYHPIHVNADDNTLLPWYSPEPGKSYDFVINQIWNFWDTIRTDMNGLPYYMNHQVWNAEVNDTRGVAGSQFEMALCSGGCCTSIPATNGSGRTLNSLPIIT